MCVCVYFVRGLYSQVDHIHIWRNSPQCIYKSKQPLARRHIRGYERLEPLIPLSRPVGVHGYEFGVRSGKEHAERTSFEGKRKDKVKDERYINLGGRKVVHD